jgi:LPXTG-site transpeptidase (sortase) family protein
MEILKRWKSTLVLSAIALSVFGVSFASLTYGSYENTEAAELDIVLTKAEARYFGVDPFWLKRYGLTVETEADVFADADRDGLTLREEYRYLTDPTDADTDDDTYLDGSEVKKGYSPLGAGRLDMDGDGLLDNWEEANGLNLKANDAALDPDQDGLSNAREFAHGTKPLAADTDGDGYADGTEMKNGYDPTKAGAAKPEIRIIIKKINVSAPVILSDSVSDQALLEDLAKGVVRYPTTASAGQDGNMVLSGHSSNYSWIKSDYNYVFRSIGKLEAGDEIVLRVTQENGKTLEYQYRMKSHAVVTPDDPAIFTTADSPTLTLVTCWPLGTQLKRYVVTAELIS